mmetsp:Transcript_5111/g.12008  ORF Transcript_5111/g.12008 Transcript_5111/m.12008 type:complete len:514 (-) Transcript_5111:68-1609(-)
MAVQGNSPVHEECSLCILGAGYAGINTFNAATKYLPEGARVVIIARERAWGGQFLDQYDYVRLHQGYRTFTAGERQWDLNVPPDHLASKKEILRHFENIADACVKEKQLRLVCLFEYEYTDHTVIGGRVKINAIPIKKGPRSFALPPMRISASAFIKAHGADVKPKLAFSFPTSPPVHSLSPVDLASPYWDLQLRYSNDKDKPIYIVGSGKTAMDAINYLSRRLEGAKDRLRCISGRGTCFVVRDEMSTYGKDLNSPDTKGPLEVFSQIIENYNGSNTSEVLREMEKRGFVHSAIPDASSFLVGVCSREEIRTARAALSPPEDKIIRAHLADVVTTDGEPALTLQALDGKTRFTRTIERGAFIINCTDMIGPLAHEPILSDDGLVVSPQNLAGFTGPSANLVTHLFYLGKLEPLWRELPRAGASPIENKTKAGLDLLMMVLINNMKVTNALPRDVRSKYLLQPEPQPEHSLKKFAALMPRLLQNHQLLTARYTDKAQTPEEVPIFGGNLRSKL